MARKVYSIFASDDSDLTNELALCDKIQVRNLATMAELNVITLLTSITPRQAYLAPNGFLYSVHHLAAATFYIKKINLETGEVTAFNGVWGPGWYSRGLYVDTNYVYNLYSGSEFRLHKFDITTAAWVSTTVISPLATDIYGIGYDGVNWWTVKNGTHLIQRRNDAMTIGLEVAYPTGYSTASFYSCEIDPENPTHLWLQGEMGTNGVIVVWDTATQTIVSEWSSADILRWKDQQFAIGGADISTPGTIQFLSVGPFKKGNAIFDYLLSDAESDVHNVVSVQYSVDGLPPLIDGLPNPDKVWLDATIGTGGSGNTNLPSSPTGEYLKKAWDTITDTGTGDTLGVYFRLILEEI